MCVCMCVCGGEGWEGKRVAMTTHHSVNNLESQFRIPTYVLVCISKFDYPMKLAVAIVPHTIMKSRARRAGKLRPSTILCSSFEWLALRRREEGDRAI